MRRIRIQLRIPNTGKKGDLIAGGAGVGRGVRAKQDDSQIHVGLFHFVFISPANLYPPEAGMNMLDK